MCEPKDSSKPLVLTSAVIGKKINGVLLIWNRGASFFAVFRNLIFCWVSLWLDCTLPAGQQSASTTATAAGKVQVTRLHQYAQHCLKNPIFTSCSASREACLDNLDLGDNWSRPKHHKLYLRYGGYFNVNDL